MLKGDKPMIKIENLHKTFNPGTINEVYALKDIDFSMKEGEFVTVIGTNGSGKSTLLNAIAGSFIPDRGIIEIDGVNVTRRKDYHRAKYIARVFQNPFMGTAPDMSIAENLLIAHLRGNPRWPKISLGKHLKQTFQEKVKCLEMGLEDRLDNIIGSLSGGQRQAVTLLMAVLKKPKVLLLDEHTAALDPKSAAQIIKLTKQFIKEDNLTAVMITHSMQQALELGDRTVMMHGGEIIENINESEKLRMTVDDFLNRFAEIRKREKLTNELLVMLKQEYC